MMFRLSIEELLEKERNNELSAYEVCSYFVGRIKQIGFELNAVFRLNPNWENEARELDKRGNKDLALFGIPYLVKDNIDLYGLPTTAGSYAFENNYPVCDAVVVRKLKQAGAICLGKTNMSELANFVTQGMKNGYSSIGGQVLNAYDINADVSGSSSGSAVAVSCGLVPFALGTDTSFSVVKCANVNGVIGYKPIKGNICMEGVLPISNNLDEIGVFTKRFDDLIKVLDVILENKIDIEEKDNVFLGVSKNNIDMVSKEQFTLYHKVLDNLCNVEYVQTPNSNHLLELMKRDFSVSLKLYLDKHNCMISNIGDLYRYYVENPEKMMKYGVSRIEEALLRERDPNNQIEINKLVFEQKVLNKKFNEVIGKYDAVLMSGADQSIHFANLPSLALPICLESDGLPRGMILYGVSEKELLSCGKYLLNYLAEIAYPKMALEC